jgi:hypothetical protein
VGPSFVLDIPATLSGSLGWQQESVDPSIKCGNKDAARLLHLPSRQWLLDPCSQSFALLMNAVERLDDKRFVHVLVPPSPNCNLPSWLAPLQVSDGNQADRGAGSDRDRHPSLNEPQPLARVDVLRRDLAFELVASGLTGRVAAKELRCELSSVQHSGYIVAAKQLQGNGLGVLLGLQHGLLIFQPFNDTKRTVLMPHGELCSTQSIFTSKGHMDCPLLDAHQSVAVVCTTAADCVRGPPVFALEVDARLRELRAPCSRLAWVYLAYLHAATAGPFPDPLTGLQGTESAMRILQSPRCFATSPTKHDISLTAHLQDLQLLAPTRNYTSVGWKANDNVGEAETLCKRVAWSDASWDGLRLAVRWLVDQSERLACLFPSDQCKSRVAAVSASEDQDRLAAKAYWRSRAGVPRLMLLDAASEERAAGPRPVVLCVFGASVGLKEQQTATVRMVSGCGQAWMPGSSVGQWRCGMLQQLLIGTATVLGPAAICDADPVYNDLQQETGSWHNKWLSLYELARYVGRGKPVHQQELTLRFARMVYLSAEKHPEDIPIICTLMTVAVNPNVFEDIRPPVYGKYEFPSENTFQEAKIRLYLENQCETFESYLARHQNSQPLKPAILNDDLSATSGSQHWRMQFCGTEEERHQRLVHMTQRQNAQVTYDASIAEWKACHKKKYNELVQAQVKHLVCITKLQWPTEAVLFSSTDFAEREGLITAQQAHSAVDETIKRWFHNYQLKCFLDNAEAALQSLYLLCPSRQSLPALDISPINWLSNSLIVDTVLRSSPRLGKPAVVPELAQAAAHSLYSSAAWPDTVDSMRFVTHRTVTASLVSLLAGGGLRDPSIKQCICKWATDELEACRARERLVGLWSAICDAVLPGEDFPGDCALATCGLMDRVLPCVLLPKLVEHCCADTELQLLVGALVIAWSWEQRVLRCLQHAEQGADVHLRREIENSGYVNWRPCERPEWLLLQVENDFMIRPMQVRGSLGVGCGRVGVGLKFKGPK